jgi:hypothetical protein
MVRYIMVLRRALLIIQGIGRGGLWKSQLFWTQMELASVVAISVPKKVFIFRAYPFQLGCAAHIRIKRK